MTDLDQFRSVYETAGVYDRHLLPHYYHGQEDTELVDDLLQRHYGPPAADLAVVEFGCGTGRITERLAPYAHQLTVADYSAAMIDAAHKRFPDADTLVADTRYAAARLLNGGRAGAFDVVAAFWSLSYPLGEFFETMTASDIRPVDDTDQARRDAGVFVRQLTELLAPGGHLLALFFDADTPEQRLVTRLWERVAPFPEGGRRYTFNLLLDGLRRAEADGRGSLTHTRYGGTAWAANRDAALAWFNVVHLKSFPELVNNSDVQRDVTRFVDQHVRPSGDVCLPSGVHMIDFHATDHSGTHLPDRLR